LIQAEFPVEFVDASAGIHQLLLACIKGVALGTYFYFDIFLCASRLNNLTASALNSRLLIIGMYSLFHHVHHFQTFLTCKPDCNIRAALLQEFF